MGSVTLSRPHVYFYVYWITAPMDTILAILAVHESFRRVFRVFYLLRFPLDETSAPESRTREALAGLSAQSP